MFVPATPQANMEFYPCPVGYCRCSHEGNVGSSTCVYSYSHSDPNLQCICDRKGEMVPFEICILLRINSITENLDYDGLAITV